ncbi:MAG: isochorismate synthase [Symploca sp. SIO3C6]|nr:isochorismate synthase [Symploca sp. SIO3C6]
MRAIKLGINPLQDIKELYQFLTTYQQIASERQQTQIVSLSLTIPLVEPLTVLEAMGQADQPHFYMERRSQAEAIAVIDVAIKKEIKGSDRFSQAQAFIDSCLKLITVEGNLHQPFSGPHFFCSFSFFASEDNNNLVLPDATIFLPAIQIARQHQECVFVANVVIAPQGNIQELVEQTWQHLQTVRTIENATAWKVTKVGDNGYPQFSDNNIEDFKIAVNSALKSIRAQDFHKLVLAHSIDVKLPPSFQLTSCLHHLRQRYAACCTFSLSNGDGTAFIGATPERLLRIQECQLTTDALAGSTPRGKTAVADNYLSQELLNNPKELHEHRVVLEFITHKLTSIGLTPLFSSEPRLLQLSNIQHLWTPIHAKISPEIPALELVESLHPTPAMAGIPREVACQQIRRYESFERNLYAAPLGWVDYQGNSEFVVGIRCALVREYWATLYAGAGIVAGSEPAKEAAEILLKFQVLLGALFDCG